MCLASPRLRMPDRGRRLVAVLACVLSIVGVLTSPALISSAHAAATFSSSPNPSQEGEPVSLVFTVPRDPSLPAPTGSVTFTNGLATIAELSLDADGVAKTSYSPGTGTHEIYAEYSGDGNYPPESSSLEQVVRGSAGLSLNSSANPSTFGMPVTFTATVSGSGSVTFRDNGTALGTVALGNSSIATYTAENLRAGTHTITAEYSGDGQHTPAADSITQQVQPALTRLAGTSRVGTAIAISRASYPEPGSAVAAVLTRSDGYADALAGGPLASAVDGPLLLTSPTALDASLREELRRVLPVGATVHLLGGTAALSEGVEAAVRGLGYRTQRLQGATRFGTAVAAAEATGTPRQIFVATGLNFPDALAGGAAAVATDGVIVLTNGTRQAAETAAYVKAHPTVRRVALGGPACTADPTASCVKGGDRYATAALVAKVHFGTAAKRVGVATGRNFPDALAAGPFLGAAGAPLLLVNTSAPLPRPVLDYLSTVRVDQAVILGGSGAVADSVGAALDTVLSTGPAR